MTDRTHDPLSPAVISSLLRPTDPYLSCDGCFNHIDAYVERLVADTQHRDQAMEVHLAGCGACADEAGALTELLTGGDH